METIYVHEHYPHHLDTLDADFTITLEELMSLKEVDFSDCNAYEDLGVCLEARANSSIYFVGDFVEEVIRDEKEFTKLIKKLKKKGKATYVSEEGVWGFSMKSADHAERVAYVKEAKLR